MKIPRPGSLRARLRPPSLLSLVRSTLRLSTLTFLAGAILIILHIPGTLLIGGALMIVSVIALWLGY